MFRLIGAVLIAAFALALSACGGGATSFAQSPPPSASPVAPSPTGVGPSVTPTVAAPSPSPVATGTPTVMPTVAPTATATPTATAMPTATALSTAPVVYYVADANAQSLNAYPLGAGGNVAPTRAITGSNTGLGFPRRVAIDATGTLYAANAPNAPQHSITEYARASTGNVAPIRTITGPNTGLTGADGILLDSSGNLYVANCTGCFQSSGTADSIFVFAPGATGNVAPIRTISGSNTQLFGTTNLALAPSGMIVATQSSGQPSILFFDPGVAGNVAPSGIINGAATGLSQPECVVLDGSGNVYVCNAGANTITVYAPGARGNVAPIRTLGGSSTMLSGPTQLAIDGSGNMYVADSGSQSLTVYGPGASGNAAPSFVVNGSATQLQAPIGLALSP